MCIYLTPLVGRTQNLVPNPSFEDVNFNFCGLFPTVNKFEESNKNWLVPTSALPEIVSEAISLSCWNYVAPNSNNSPRTGKRAAVILIYDKRNFRSYLQVKLNAELEKNKIYYTEVFVRIDKHAKSTCNNLGLYFSDTLVRENVRSNLNFKPQVNHNEVLRDTASWISLKGKFKATSNAKYLLIGNFYDNESTRIERIRHASEFDPGAVFLFIDDVSVRNCISE
jgi:hypothetical protein